MKRLQIITSFCLLILSFPGAAQDKQAATAQLVNSHNYIFKAQMAMPSGPAPTRQLTSEYDLRVSSDSLIAYLPYYGRAYVAPLDPTQGGIQFTSTKFSYKVTSKKKGWDILIKPTDTDQASQMVLSVTTSGYATLQVIGNNRQPISFTGYITSQRKR